MGLVWDCEITRYNWKYLVLYHQKSVICLTQKKMARSDLQVPGPEQADGSSCTF